jgi:acyl-ACP thioesterase
MGHVNNAAYWSAVEQRARGGSPDLRVPTRARLDYRHSIDLDEEVELLEQRSAGRLDLAFAVGDTVKAVVLVEPLG